MPAPNAGRAFALVVVDELVRHGVTDAVLAPGSRSTPLALAFAEDSRIRLHVRIDERSAAFTAVGLARVCGRVVPLLCTSGTAAAEFHAAVLEADESRVPLLVLTADRPPELRGVGANQTLDQIKLYGGAVRWFHEMGVPEPRADSVRYWRSTVSRAVAAASGTAGVPGPVHLNVPLREPLVATDDGVGFAYDLGGRADGRPWTAATTAPRPLPPTVRERLGRATSGVVVAGDGMTTAQAASVATFAEQRRWPLIAEPHSNARRGRAAVVGADALLRNSDFVSAHAPDVVVVCGRIGLSRALLAWVASAACDVVVLDGHGAWWDPTRGAALVIAADAASLSAADGSTAPEQWSNAWLEAGSAARAAIDDVLDEDHRMNEPRLARDVVAQVPAGALIAVASSMPIRDVDLTMRPRDDIRVVANRGVSGIDGFVSTAVGAALAHDGPAWALAGDLSLLHDVNGLLADPAPDLTVVVVNNDGGGIFSLLPQATGGDSAVFERVFGTPHGVDIGDVVRGYGGNHVAVIDVEQLHEAVAATPKGLTVVEARTHREANALLHRRLDAAAAQAVGEWMSRR